MGSGMTYFELSFIVWACLGDFNALGLAGRPIPAPARPLLATVQIGGGAPACRAVIQIERPLNREAADRRIKALGQIAAPSLRWCERFRCWPREIVWKERLVIDGREIR